MPYINERVPAGRLVDMKGAIRVFCRVRPLLPHEDAAGTPEAALCDPHNACVTVTAGRRVLLHHIP